MERSSFLFYIILFSGFASIITFLSTHAAAQETVETLPEIVVTATRVEDPRKEVPASIHIITHEDIRNSTAKNAGDLIAEAAIGHIHKYNGALAGRIEIRGLSTDPFSSLNSRVLVLVNGSNAGTVNLAKISVDEIERVEIMKGPASVLYGSSAMGGVINIVTKEGKEEGFHSSLGGEIGSWDYWKILGELSEKKGSFAFYLTASRSASGDYSARDYGKIQNTAYDDETVSARLGYEFLDMHHISLGFQHWKGWNIGSPGARYSPDPDNYSDKGRNGFDIGYKTKTFDAKYYLVKDRDELHGSMMSGPGNSDISLTKTDSLGASLQKAFSIGGRRIIIGGQWDRIDVESRRNTGAPYYPDSRYNTYGLFTEGRLSLFDKKLLLSAGLRYDYFENSILATPGIASLNPRTEHIDHVSGRGGLVYRFSDDLSLKGNIGTAFRAPAPLELVADYVMWGRRYLGNPDLKPEQSTSYDVGVSYAKGVFRGDLAFFHTDFKDKIVSVYDSALKASTYKNIEGATLQGIELNASYDIGPSLGLNGFIKPFTNVTYHARYEDKSQSNPTTLLYIPKWTGAFGIRAGQEKWGAQLLANYTGDEKVTDWNPSSPTYGETIDKGDFMVVSVKGSYRPIERLEITASIENIFDRAYGYVLGYPMPGRTFAAGVKWIF